MEQRQPVGDRVALGPLPRVGERVEVRGERAARQDRALGRRRWCPTCRRSAPDPRRRARRSSRSRRRAIVEVDGHRPRTPASASGTVAPAGTSSRSRRGVSDDMRKLAGAGLGVDRDHRHARQQRADHRHAGLRARVGEHRRARRGPASEPATRSGRIAQLPVGQRAIRETRSRPRSDGQRAIQTAPVRSS